MDDNYKRDIEQTEDLSENYPAGYKHAENLTKMLIEDLKSYINERFSNLEKTIDSVEFTKKSTIWIILLSSIMVLFSILEFFFK